MKVYIVENYTEDTEWDDETETEYPIPCSFKVEGVDSVFINKDLATKRVAEIERKGDKALILEEEVQTALKENEQKEKESLSEMMNRLGL